MQGAQFFHRPFSPPNTLWNASTPLCAEVFVDEGMFLEAKIRQRIELSTNVWGNGSDLILGDWSISKKKLSHEGTWGRSLYYSDTWWILRKTPYRSLTLRF